jgi:hypothetical protein
MMTNILCALTLELENVRNGVNTSITCEFIFNLNFSNFESKLPQIKGSLKAWILNILNFIEIHKVKANAHAFNNV